MVSVDRSVSLPKKKYPVADMCAAPRESNPVLHSSLVGRLAIVQVVAGSIPGRCHAVASPFQQSTLTQFEGCCFRSNGLELGGTERSVPVKRFIYSDAFRPLRSHQ